MHNDNNMLTAMQDAKRMFLNAVNKTWEDCAKIEDAGKRVRAWHMAHMELVKQHPLLAFKFILGALTIGLEQLNLLSDEEKVELELDNLD